MAAAWGNARWQNTVAQLERSFSQALASVCAGCLCFGVCMSSSCVQAYRSWCRRSNCVDTARMSKFDIQAGSPVQPQMYTVCFQGRATTPAWLWNGDMGLCPCSRCICIHFFSPARRLEMIQSPNQRQSMCSEGCQLLTEWGLSVSITRIIKDLGHPRIQQRNKFCGEHSAPWQTVCMTRLHFKPCLCITIS